MSMWAMSRRRKVAVGVVGTLVTLNGVYGGWTWLENTRLVNQITRSFISPELEEALQSIKGVVAAFERDVRTDVKWDWKRDRVPSALVNLLILNTIHERAAALQAPPKEGVRTRNSLLPSDEAAGKEAARYIRFASSAYGMFMLKGANVMSWDSGWPPVHKFSLQELNSWCITKHCGIPDEDLVKVNLFEERTLHLPGYILAVDHATRSVVLSVRGTFSMQDTVTDLVCDSADFMGGSCHRGLRRSAETLLEDVRGDLLRHLAQHKGYRLVLCGHSLGGGVSILLTMMLLKRRRELGLGGTEVLCYAFAPPPVFAPLEKLPGQTRRAIRSFVFGNDMVCRLSLATAYGLFRDLKEVDAIGASLSARCKYLALERRPHLSVDDDGRGAVGMRVAYRYATILHRTRSRGGNGSGTKTRQNGVGGGGGVGSGGGGGGRGGGGYEGGGGSGSEGGGGGGGGDENHPVENFVRKKLAEDFTATGTAAAPPPATGSARRPPLRKRRLTSGAAWRHGYELAGFDPVGLDRLGDAGGGGGGDGGDVGDRYKKLMIPGSIYHMKKLGPESKAAGAAAMLGGTPSEMRSRLYWMERERPEEFARLLMVDTAIVDHLPAAYEDALHALYGDGLPQREQEQD